MTDGEKRYNVYVYKIKIFISKNNAVEEGLKIK